MSYIRWTSGVTGDWYIFHHCNSGRTREEQLLAVYCAREQNCPLMLYPEVAEIVATETWHKVKGWVNDKDTQDIAPAFKEFLKDIDEDFKWQEDKAEKLAKQVAGGKYRKEIEVILAEAIEHGQNRFTKLTHDTLGYHRELGRNDIRSGRMT